jgi:hypothetical protein
MSFRDDGGAVLVLGWSYVGILPRLSQPRDGTLRRSPFVDIHTHIHATSQEVQTDSIKFKKDR